MVQNRNKPGFLLIEILTSFLFLGIISVIIASFQGRSAQLKAQANKRLEAILLARTYLESLHAGQKPVEIPKPFTVTLQNSPYFSHQFYHQKRLIISWEEQNKSYAITFDTGLL